MINLILTGFLIGLIGWYFLKIQQLEKHFANCQSNIHNLSYTHKEASDFMENQIAKTYYQMSIGMGQLKFTPDTTLANALSYDGARDILVKYKLIKKNEQTGLDVSLAQRAKDNKVALAPALVVLNFLEAPL